MRNFWVYDWEVYYNFACVTFIHTSTPKAYVEAYIKVDIKYLEVRNKLAKFKELNANNIDDYILDENSEYYVLDKEYRNLAAGKTRLISLMTSKQFILYRDPTDETRNINQLSELIMFFENHKVLMGFNSVRYDSLITDYIICHGRSFDRTTGYNSNNIHITECLKEISTEVISVSNSDMYGFQYAWLPKRYYRLFEDYDIQKILYLDKTYTGLKSVAINLKWHRIQELPIHFDNIVQFEDVWTIFDYNINDVLITLWLVWNQEEEIELREQISERYNINVLNDSRSSIGKRLMSKYYEEESGVAYKDFKEGRTHRGRMRLSTIISDKIKFKTKHFKDFLTELKNDIVSPGEDWSKLFRYNGTTYTIAKGGIHSIDDSRIYNSIKDGFIYRDADVTSYYPSILIIFLIAPAHLAKHIFLKLVKFFKDDRVRAKKGGFKLEAEALKIVINRIYGALKDINDYLFDPKATYETTFNGQLSLLMLVEDLEVESNGNIHIISANTDGLVARFKPEYEALYNAICKRWEETTGFELEYTDYERYVRNNVNNYIAVKKGFSDSISKLDKTSDDYVSKLKELEKKYVKGKGDFISETPFDRGFVHPIVSIALREYALYDTDYRDVVHNHWKQNKFNIYDYCMSQKVDKKFDVYYARVEDGIIKKTPLQQYNRFYITSKGGGTITKEVMKMDKLSIGSIVAKQQLAIFNDYEERDDYNINYGYYINIVEKFLYFRNKNPKGNHKLEGLHIRDNNLFSELEDEK